MPQELFERIVKKWRKRSDPTEGLTLPQIANIALGSGNNRNASIVGSTLSLFIRYFHAPRGPQAYKWRVNWTTVQRDYPHLFDDTLAPTILGNGGVDQQIPSHLEEMKRALDD